MQGPAFLEMDVQQIAHKDATCEDYVNAICSAEADEGEIRGFAWCPQCAASEIADAAAQPTRADLMYGWDKIIRPKPTAGARPDEAEKPTRYFSIIHDEWRPIVDPRKDE